MLRTRAARAFWGRVCPAVGPIAGHGVRGDRIGGIIVPAAWMVLMSSIHRARRCCRAPSRAAARPLVLSSIAARAWPVLSSLTGRSVRAADRPARG